VSFAPRRVESSRSLPTLVAYYMETDTAGLDFYCAGLLPVLCASPCLISVVCTAVVVIITIIRVTV